MLENLNDKKASAIYQLRKVTYTVKSRNAKARLQEKYENEIELCDALIVVLETEIAAIEALDK